MRSDELTQCGRKRGRCHADGGNEGSLSVGNRDLRAGQELVCDFKERHPRLFQKLAECSSISGADCVDRGSRSNPRSWGGGGGWRFCRHLLYAFDAVPEFLKCIECWLLLLLSPLRIC